jgi:hypothetical protein
LGPSSYNSAKDLSRFIEQSEDWGKIISNSPECLFNSTVLDAAKNTIAYVDNKFIPQKLLDSSVNQLVLSVDVCLGKAGRVFLAKVKYGEHERKHIDDIELFQKDNDLYAIKSLRSGNFYFIGHDGTLVTHNQEFSEFRFMNRYLF